MKMLQTITAISLFFLLASPLVANVAAKEDTVTEIPAAQEMQLSQEQLGDLDVTMEILDEDLSSAENLVNSLSLPIAVPQNGRDEARSQLQEIFEQQEQVQNEIIEEQAETLHTLTNQIHAGQGSQGGPGSGK